MRPKTRPPFWTEVEDQILRDHYPTMSHTVTDLLPGRSRLAVAHRASECGIRAKVSVYRGRPDRLPIKIPALVRETAEALAAAPDDHLVRLVIDDDGKPDITADPDPQVLPGTVGIYSRASRVYGVADDIRARLAELAGVAA